MRMRGANCALDELQWSYSRHAGISCECKKVAITTTNILSVKHSQQHTTHPSIYPPIQSFNYLMIDDSGKGIENLRSRATEQINEWMLRADGSCLFSWLLRELVSCIPTTYVFNVNCFRKVTNKLQKQMLQQNIQQMK